MLNMATKKRRKSASAAPRRYYAAPKRKTYRKKSGVSMIPSAAATVGVVIANKEPIMNMVNNPSIEGAKASVRYALQPEQIKKTVIHGAAGLVAGAAIKKFAPKFIKTPLGKVAKKIPKVI